MNASRRKRLKAVAEQLVGLQTELDILQDQEDEAFEALPDRLKETKRGEAMQTACTDIEEARDGIEAVIDAVERAMGGPA